MTVGGYRVDKDDEGLTAAEREVLPLLRSGKRKSVIARELGKSRERIGQIERSIKAKGISTERVASDDSS